ncbi:hypothetical protein H0I39_04415 [Ottowia beijingensis]|uniref:Toprim domain-containing protein n=1 Tax=Ottowia beijingensis TaxID=1207057 RepID=A0A853IVV6_9BURK|nr:hypothetical protein [Ottowia beijingensis]NZA01200.1 hypothetical protein [Ottowia beijingensis]
MLRGMRAKGSVFRIGSPKARRTWLVEGYATGLSLHAALTLLRLPDAVLVCFSASNLKYVASVVHGVRLVFADNDASGTGERVARETGLPYCMAPVVGWDANDMHIKQGVFALADLVRATVAGPPCDVDHPPRYLPRSQRGICGSPNTAAGIANTALVGHGLTAAAQGESPTVGSGAETGERVAKLAPLHRTAGGSCNATGEKSEHVKAYPGWARSVRSG